MNLFSSKTTVLLSFLLILQLVISFGQNISYQMQSQHLYLGRTGKRIPLSLYTAIRRQSRS
jgi:hypothetical protein